MDNYMKLEIPSKSQNEAFARITVAAFAAQADPTIDEISDIKTAVSEAVTNAVIHGYEGGDGTIYVTASLAGRRLEVTVVDHGVGITDLDQARQPLFTSKPELDRSGMGFTIMENFMDEFTVTSETDKGTTVSMVKIFGQAEPGLDD
ncbi:anti-sigma F factor [Dethiobacter alkaliphilus]|uniref:Anti-sigma regulatory factor, serine/threonine protein kinase n=1 Tax=Dethiobacter alkaliphilus AHT 1 TaxID=555088 RepID=C0GDZ8_DETAL|nr:anti-sigma F factor [Dethiobacter alkaliphilus]EEG78292.1 anti-sigma regulatory factor, serine/threonine protein kinase [Dethiobacter alkaliphilus AHT 1]MCW3491450.1 anti-sigma F factor [Dethiobacter alkaliphilus]